jgi:hypothetical protein
MHRKQALDCDPPCYQGLDNKSQAFGDARLFHKGIRLYIAWCDLIPGIEQKRGNVSHDGQHRAWLFQMIHQGKPGFEWWIVEPL